MVKIRNFGGSNGVFHGTGIGHRSWQKPPGLREMGGRAGRVNAVGAMMGVMGLVLLGTSSPETMVFTMVFTMK